MRSSLFKFSFLLSLGMIAVLLNACALDAIADPPDPPGGCTTPPSTSVNPDTTVPPTLKVKVCVMEDQDASDGTYGSSDVTVWFETNEISQGNTVVFTHREQMNCFFNNVSKTINLGTAASYPVDHLRMDTIPITYRCDYLYPGGSEQIFSFTSPTSSLGPSLLRPVSSPSTNFKVNYTPGDTSPPSPCTVQVTANDPNGISVVGNTVSQAGDVYTGGTGVSTLHGPGNIEMTRSCTPTDFDRHNAADDTSPGAFDAVTVTYISKASSEVTWIF